MKVVGERENGLESRIAKGKSARGLELKSGGLGERESGLELKRGGERA